MWRFRRQLAKALNYFTAPPRNVPNDPTDRATPPCKGTVLWFDRDRGYGRIRPADGGRAIIVYQSSVEQSGLIGLFPGQEVDFDRVPWVGHHARAGILRLTAACAE
jgi:cold shock protein